MKYITFSEYASCETKKKDYLQSTNTHFFYCTETIWYGRLQTMPEVKFEKLNDDEVVVKLKEYQYVIGSLTYASIEMRPNI